MSTFADQVVMITGAAGNLGSAAARAFYEAGASLVLVGHNLDKLESRFADIADSERVWFAAVDLTDPAAVEGMAFETVQNAGRIDVLANVAGGYTKGPRVHETPLETWRQMQEMNANSVYYMARAVVPHMLEQGNGRIVNIAARAGLSGSAQMGAYVVSKSAVIRLTETMAAELKDHGIRVNCILPGTIDTPQNRAAMPNANLDKWVTPEALADVILFLASDAARAVTGAAIPVYGRG